MHRDSTSSHAKALLSLCHHTFTVSNQDTWSPLTCKHKSPASPSYHPTSVTTRKATTLEILKAIALQLLSMARQRKSRNSFSTTLIQMRRHSLIKGRSAQHKARPTSQVTIFKMSCLMSIVR